MFRSVKSKFILFSVILILLTTIIPMYFLVIQLRSNFKERSNLMLSTTIDVVRTSLKLAMTSGNQTDLENIIQEISKKEGIYKIRIFNKTGNIKFSSVIKEINKNIVDLGKEHSNLNISEIDSAQQVISGNIYSSIEPLGNEKICQSCHKETGPIAYLNINTGLTKSENNFFTGSTHMIFLAWGFIIILIIGLYIIFDKNIYKPIQKINLAIKYVEEGKLDTKLDYNIENEITSVYKHFNEMTDKLEDSHEKIEQLHYEELQRANRLKTIGELTSQTAHEINNHIAIIMSRTEYLEIESEKNNQLSMYKDDLKALLSQINNISTITRNILKYSKKNTKDIKEINLIKTVEEIIQLMKPTLKKKNIKLINKSVGGSHLIKADEVQIKQILTNLINNSEDAITENGIIEISIVETSNSQIALSVKDNGHGIKQELKEEIFSPFFTTKDIENRTGLGLYIIKKICETHNAEIKLISKENEGTTFIIIFNKV